MKIAAVKKFTQVLVAMAVAAVMVLGVIIPKRFIALPAEPDVPDHAHPFLGINACLPKRAEFLRVLAVHRLQIGISLGKHLCAQRFGVVVGDDKAPISAAAWR